ncbi:hypothetical protein HYV73_00710 [Candidatus Uhrbacteria bacterium]|nr:hypothetical protein [Candidatus Uhrbacteria bacterium]
MKRTEFNTKFRQHTREKLSPTQREKDFVSALYAELQKVLGVNNCIQIGSYPRFTAHTPLHDLDVLYFAGQYDPRGVNPTNILSDLKKAIDRDFVNPTSYNVSSSLQTHSVTMSFASSGQEVFAIDIVPAYISETKNEFGDDTYWVPEIMTVGHSKRKSMYEQHLRDHMAIEWIKSDPRGYIKVAQELNSQNDDFRKAVKFVKAWKHGCKKIDDTFKLKSFHVEQIITQYFQQDSSLDLIGAIFKFFCDLESIISQPQIRDRANSTKYIDDYLNELNPEQKRKILEARDFFMNKLERHTEASPMPILLVGGFYERKSDSEQFLYDLSIPTFIEDQYDFVVDGKVEKKDGFRGGYWLSENQDKAPTGLKIYFQLRKDNTGAPLCKWKVKNHDNCEQPRGELNDHRTRNHPESTAYKGEHYVECYAIKNGACVARHKRSVIIH